MKRHGYSYWDALKVEKGKDGQHKADETNQDKQDSTIKSTKTQKTNNHYNKTLARTQNTQT